MQCKPTKKCVLFISIFTVLGLLALQVPFTQIVGSGVKFTLFDFFGPIATGFIGTIPGLVSIFLMQFVNFLIHGAEVIDAGTIIRFFPVLFAAWYFVRKGHFNWVISLLAIIAFNMHPIGRSAWYYSMYWLIPIIMYFLRDKYLLARALGTTFTAHAIGSTLYLWVFALPKAVWIGLIPVVAMERALFAVGIAVMYLVFNNALAYLMKKKVVRLGFVLDERYVFGFLR